MVSWSLQGWARKGQGRLAGRVLHESGRPVAGACVRLRPGDQTITTREDGAFAFEGLAPRRYILAASTDEVYAGPTVVRARDVTEPIILRAHPAATIVLRVAANRAPVVGARVVLGHFLHIDSYAYPLEMEPRLTDAEGSVTIRGLAPSNYLGRVTAPGPGWAQEPLSISCRDRGGTVEHVATLEPGAPIRGTVRGPFNRPVKGATISLWHSSKRHSLYQAESDEHGTWSIDAPAGHYRVVAHSHRYRTAGQLEIDTDGRTAQEGLILPLGLPTMEHALAAWLRVDRFIDRGKRKRISGVVLDIEGMPVEEAPVHGSPMSGEKAGRYLSAITDSNGHFEFEAPHADEYEIKAGWTDPRNGHDAVTKRVRTGTSDVKLVLTSGATLTGRVLLDGEPLRHFGVTVQEQNYSPFGGSPKGVQSDDGSFVLNNLNRGTWRVTILGPGTHRKVFDAVALERGKRVDLGVIMMERGDRVTGHVFDRSGAPLNGARVFIGRHLTEDRSRLEQWFQGEYATTTDATGEYVFEGVDTHSPHVATPLIVAKHISAGASLLQELPQGDAKIDLVLQGAGSIHGVIEGVQSRHMSVLAKRFEEPNGRRRAFARSGSFRFEDVPQGEYELAFDLPEGEQGETARVTVVPNESAKVTLKFTTSTVQLKLNVKGKSVGRDRQHVELDPRPLDRIVSSMTMSDDLVTYSFQYVKPGTYRLSVDGKKTWREFAVAATPAEQSIDVSLDE